MRRRSQLGENASIRRLTADIRGFVGRHFDGPEPIVWPPSTDDRLAAVARPAPFIVPNRTAARIGGNELGQRNGPSPTLERSQDRNSICASSAGQSSTRQEGNAEEGSGDAAEPNAVTGEDCDCSRLDCALQHFQMETLSEVIIMLASIDRDVVRPRDPGTDGRAPRARGRQGQGSHLRDSHAPNRAARRFRNGRLVRCSSLETVEAPTRLTSGEVVVGFTLGPFRPGSSPIRQPYAPACRTSASHRRAGDRHYRLARVDLGRLRRQCHARSGPETPHVSVPCVHDGPHRSADRNPGSAHRRLPLRDDG